MLGWLVVGLGISHPPDSMDRPHLIFSISHRLYLLPPSYKNFNLESFSHQRKYHHHYAMEAIINPRERRLHSRTLQMPTPQPASLFGCAGGGVLLAEPP